MPIKNNNDPIFICGPTASGKTTIAIKLALAIGGEIVNGDAYQVYRGLEFLTAAPLDPERTIVQHHLFGILDPSELSDAANHRKLALETIADIQSRGKHPIIVGGSGLYLKFLSHGPSPVPKGDEQLRAELDKLEDNELVSKLTALDPEGAKQTNLKNRRYVTRALEICMLSGNKMSEIKHNWAASSGAIENSLKGIVVSIDRWLLSERILSRTQQILFCGAMDEVARIKHPSTTCEKAIGFREIKSYLDGELEYNELVHLIHIATRQYAKRQQTWFNREQWLKPFPFDGEISTLIKTLDL